MENIKYILTLKTLTGMDPKQASILAQDLGSGEIFLNSIDRDGSRKGYDLDLAKMVTESIKIPVILCGGVGSFSDFHQGVLNEEQLLLRIFFTILNIVLF